MRKADNLPPSCAVVMKSGNLNFLEPCGPLQACNGTALPFYNIISSYLFMCFPSSLFPQVFQSKTLYPFLICSIHVLCYTDLITHDYGITYYEAPYFVSFCVAVFIFVAVFLGIC